MNLKTAVFAAADLIFAITDTFSQIFC